MQNLDEPTTSEETSNTSAAQVLDIPTVEETQGTIQQQEEFRQKFLDTILAATEGEQ